ncbi:MAG: polyprenyl synthetase family protein [archaeon]|nr:polyprenyl synthetase family protein [archaeon]
MFEDWCSSIQKELADVENEIINVVRSNNKELNEMCTYVVTSKGKRIRPAICILSYLACGGNEPCKAVKIGSAFEIVHSASLIHDDINDKSEIRRGRRTLHKEYTVSKAIVAGDYMMAKGFQILGNTSLEIVNIIVEAASHMSEGEFVQKDFEHSKDVNEENYYEIIEGKTAKLIEACAKSGAYMSGANHKIINAIGKFAIGIGMAFQIIDDVLDITGNSTSMGKKIGIDFLEGKPTLPIILAMKDQKYGSKIAETFMKNPCEEKDVDSALKLIKKTDAIEQCRQIAENMVEKAITNLVAITKSVYKSSLISLAHYIVARDR